MAEKVAARKSGIAFIYSTGPDVCLTPIGDGMVPIAYNSIAFFDTAVRTTPGVFNNKALDFQLNSRASVSTGHEPGTGKGVKVPGYLGMALVKEGSSTEASDGYAGVRHDDPAWINRPGPGGEEPRSPKETVKVKIA